MDNPGDDCFHMRGVQDRHGFALGREEPTRGGFNEVNLGKLDPFETAALIECIKVEDIKSGEIHVEYRWRADEGSDGDPQILGDICPVVAG